MSSRHFSHTIRLRHGDVNEIVAGLDCEAHHCNEGGFRRRTCTIKLQSDRCQVQGEGTDFFNAFCRVREALTTYGLVPQCYGASRNVYPSGMARDMGEGLSAYKFRMSEPARREDIVSILADGPDMEPTSVAPQRDFLKAWLKSLGYPPVA